MKKFRKLKFLKAMLLVALCVVFISCDDDDEAVVVELTEEDVAEIIASSLSEEDGGFAADIDNLLDEAEDDCGYVKTESLTDKDDTGVNTYEIAYDFSMEVVCDEANQLTRIDYDYNVERAADLISMNVNSNADSKWAFFREGDFYILDGNYKYNGEEAFKIGDENTYTSELSISSKTLKVNDFGDFLSGTMELNYSITSTSGDQGAEGGSVEITDTNTGLLDVSSFKFLYEIDLKTGDVKQIPR